MEDVLEQFRNLVQALCVVALSIIWTEVLLMKRILLPVKLIVFIPNEIMKIKPHDSIYSR